MNNHTHFDKEQSSAASSRLPSRVEFHGKKKKPGGKKNKESKKGSKVNKGFPMLQSLVAVLLLMPFLIYGTLHFISGIEKTGGSSKEGAEEVIFEEGGETASVDLTPPAKSEQEAGSKEKAKEKEKQQQKELAEQKQKQREKERMEAEKAKQQAENKPKPVPPAAAAPSVSKPDNPPAQEGKTVYHTVQPGETLFRIAMKYYQSQAGIEKIRQANGISGNEISVGQKLKVPLQ